MKRALALICGGIFLALGTVQVYAQSVNSRNYSIIQQTRITSDQGEDDDLWPVRSAEDPFSIVPLAKERLPKPIQFAGCPCVSVVEWRPYNNTPNVSRALGAACAAALQHLPLFAKTHHLGSIDGLKSFHHFFGFIPDDNSFRNLNDNKFRFKDAKTYNEYGGLITRWGWTSYSSMSFVYSGFEKNGKIDNEVVRIFVHELYHSLSYYLSLNNIDEEKMAVRFSNLVVK